MAFNKQFISTTAGNCILDSDNYVQVEINEGEHIKKRLGDVNVGDMVLFKKECISKTLEEVEEAVLEKEPRYMHSKNILHEVNNKGEYIPKFRNLIIRGVLNSKEQYQPSLEDIILKQTGDFSKKEYIEMENVLESCIQDKGMQTLSYGQHRNWLLGNTVAPENWDFFRALEGINPEFKEWVPDNNLTGLYFSYRYYNAARRCLMSKIARCKALGKGPSQDSDSPKPDKIINLKPFLRELTDHFFKEKNMDYIYARVTKISNLYKKGQQDYIEKTDTNLTKGVAVFDAENVTNSSEKNFEELLEDECIIYDYFSTIINDGTYQDKHKTLLTNHLHGETDKSLKMTTSFPYLLEWFGDIDPFMKSCKKAAENWWMTRCKDGKAHINEISNHMKEMVLDGRIDDSWGLEKGTVYNMLKVLYKLKAAIPSRIHKYSAECMDFKQESVYKYEKICNLAELAKRTGKPLNRGIDEVILSLWGNNIFPDSDTKYKYNCIIKKQKDLESEYKISLRPFAASYNFKKNFISTLAIVDIRTNKMVHMAELMANKIIPLEPIDKQSLSEQIYSREYVQKVLNKYGLGSIIDVKKEEFVWEEKPSIIGSYANKIGNLFKKKI